MPRKTRLRLNLSVAGLPTMRAPVPLHSGGVTLRIAPLIRETGADCLIEIIAVVERVEALEVAPKRMADADALATLDWASGAVRDYAISIFVQKQNDLWAAGVAALTLARSGEIGTRLPWFENLANWAPHIADAPIALAGALAVAGDGETAALERKPRPCTRPEGKGVGIQTGVMPLNRPPLAPLLLAVAMAPMAATSPAAAGPEVRATVLSIGDGDTIRVQQGQQRLMIRLACIDAPEMAQAPYRAQSRAYRQSGLRVGPTVTLLPQTVDRNDPRCQPRSPLGSTQPQVGRTDAQETAP